MILQSSPPLSNGRQLEQHGKSRRLYVVRPRRGERGDDVVERCAAHLDDRCGCPRAISTTLRAWASFAVATRCATSSAARPWIHAADAPAVSASAVCASSVPAMPERTSPLPAAARIGVPAALTRLDPVGRGHHRREPFEEHGRAGSARAKPRPTSKRQLRTLSTVGPREARELDGVGREEHRASAEHRARERGDVAVEDIERVGVEQHRPTPRGKHAVDETRVSPPRPSPGPMTTPSAQLTMLALERSVVRGPGAGESKRLGAPARRGGSPARRATAPCRRRCASRRARRASAAPAMPPAPPMIASFLRVPLWASAAIGGTCARDPRVVDDRWRAVVATACTPSPMSSTTMRRMRSRATSMPALHRAEGEREIGGDARLSHRAGGGVDAASGRRARRSCPRVALRRCSGDGVGDRTARRARRACAEQAVHDDRSPRRATSRRDDARPCELRARARARRRRRESCSDRLDDAHRDTCRGERARDHPRVAAVVARSGEDADSLRAAVAAGGGRSPRRGRAGALHERARGHASGDGGGVPRSRLRTSRRRKPARAPVASATGAAAICGRFRSCVRSSAHRCRCAR